MRVLLTGERHGNDESSCVQGHGPNRRRGGTEAETRCRRGRHSASPRRRSAARDVHIVRGEYPVKPGLILGHEPVGVIDELGAGLEAAIHGRPAGHRRRHHAVRAVLLLPERRALAVRRRARRLALRQHDQRRLGGIPARARRARQPRADPGRPDRRRRACCARTSSRPGCRGAESGNIQVGDAVAVFAQGPIGLCATRRREAARARRSSSASTRIAERLEIARSASAPTSR